MAERASLRPDRAWSLWLIVLGGLAFVADEGTKALAWHLMPVFPLNSGVWLIRPFLFLQHREHVVSYGAEDALKVVLCPILVVVLAWLYRRSRVKGLDRTAAVVVTLFLTGATSNAFDRLSHGSVTDFIGVRLPAGLAFTNLADLYLFTGYILIPVVGLTLVVRAWRSRSAVRERAMCADGRPD